MNSGELIDELDKQIRELDGKIQRLETLQRKVRNLSENDFSEDTEIELLQSSKSLRVKRKLGSPESFEDVATLLRAGFTLRAFLGRDSYRRSNSKYNEVVIELRWEPGE